MEYGRRFVISMVIASWCCLALAGCQSGSVKPQTPGTLRVLTYNIHHGEAMDKKFDYQRLAKVINDLSPDIVALQEVDVGTERAGGVDQAALLGKLCRMHHAFGPAMPYQGGQYGEAILSRFPIEKVLVHPLPYDSSRSRGPPWKCGSSRTASGQLPSLARTCAIRRSRTAFSRPSGSDRCSPSRRAARSSWRAISTPAPAASP